jgi:EEF1A N-terminal glycine/lysine methyltransferase
MPKYSCGGPIATPHPQTHQRSPELTLPQGFVWGSCPDNLTRHLDQPLSGFDLLILADLLFNHSEHSKLISSVKQTLKRSPEALALVFFTPYRPWLLEKDLAFFDLAKDAGFAVEKLLEHVMEKTMFDNDPGVSYCLFFLFYFPQ